jgi:heptosyltransferase-2
VTNDSGPMHIAVAMNTPTVAIFGPTVPEFGFSPLGERDRVIEREIECRPCSLHGNDRCRDNGFRCMSLIGAEEVFEVVTGALNGQ